MKEVYRSAMNAPRSTRSLRTPAPRTCARCGAEMEERKCKIVCANCGFYHDCSDP
jgi:hypothetical protein